MTNELQTLKANALKRQISRITVSTFVAEEDFDNLFTKEDFQWVSKQDAKTIVSYLIINWIRRTNAVEQIMKNLWVKNVDELIKLKYSKEVPLHINLIGWTKELQWYIYEVQKSLLNPWLIMLKIWYMMKERFKLTDEDIEDEIRSPELQTN